MPWYFYSTAGEYSVREEIVPQDQAHRLRPRPPLQSRRALPSALRDARVHRAWDNQLWTDIVLLRHVVRGSDLLCSVSNVHSYVLGVLVNTLTCSGTWLTNLESWLYRPSGLLPQMACKDKLCNSDMLFVSDCPACPPSWATTMPRLSPTSRGRNSTSTTTRSAPSAKGPRASSPRF